MPWILSGVILLIYTSGLALKENLPTTLSTDLAPEKWRHCSKRV
jgi:hypothetical protein